MEESSNGESRSRFVASIERFTGLLLDRLKESPSGKLMDEKETRMLGSVVMRSYNIWERSLASQQQEDALREKLRHLKAKVPETIEKGEAGPSGRK